MSDPIGAGEQPRCPSCGVLMRDEPGAYVCPACGERVALPPAPMPPHFEGDGIHGG